MRSDNPRPRETCAPRLASNCRTPCGLRLLAGSLSCTHAVIGAAPSFTERASDLGGLWSAFDASKSGSRRCAKRVFFVEIQFGPTRISQLGKKVYAGAGTVTELVYDPVVDKAHLRVKPTVGGTQVWVLPSGLEPHTPGDPAGRTGTVSVAASETADPVAASAMQRCVWRAVGIMCHTHTRTHSLTSLCVCVVQGGAR